MAQTSHALLQYLTAAGHYNDQKLGYGLAAGLKNVL